MELRRPGWHARSQPMWVFRFLHPKLHPYYLVEITVQQEYGMGDSLMKYYHWNPRIQLFSSFLVYTWLTFMFASYWWLLELLHLHSTCYLYGVSSSSEKKVLSFLIASYLSFTLLHVLLYAYSVHNNAHC